VFNSENSDSKKRHECFPLTCTHAPPKSKDLGLQCLVTPRFKEDTNNIPFEYTKKTDYIGFWGVIYSNTYMLDLFILFLESEFSEFKKFSELKIENSITPLIFS